MIGRVIVGGVGGRGSSGGSLSGGDLVVNWRGEVAAVRVLFALVLAASACSSAGTAAHDGGTVVGRVLSAPSCPVERAGHPCPPRPVVGGSIVALQARHIVASTHTDAGGRFQLSLDAGRYVIRATDTGALATAAQRIVDVAAGATIGVELVVDSGIR